MAGARAGGRRVSPRTYEIAGSRVVADQPIAQLAPFALTSGSSSAAFARAPARDVRELPLRFDGRVWLGGLERRLICRADDTQCWLAAEGMAEVVVALDRGVITRLGSRAFASTIACDQDAMDLVVGPALILALAARGVFCLHASAVAVGGRCRLFLGASGVGKSTLVAGLPTGARRLADDIVPLTCGPPPRAVPAFPQPKLAAAEQPVGVGALALDGLIVLDAAPPAGNTLIERSVLGTADATLALAHHSVGARLFGPLLLERHIDLCAVLAGAGPVTRVRFRRDLQLLPQLRRALLS